MTTLLEMTRGTIPAELVFKNGRVVDVFSGKLVETDVAVGSGIILGMGRYQGQEEVDLENRILCPAFIDGHCHIESGMAGVGEYARRLVALGTTTIFADPHEIANVAGLEGIRYILAQGEQYPWNLYLMLPSCVPASPWETAGAVLEAKDLKQLIKEPGVFGLGEVMNYPGVIHGDHNLWRKLELFRNRFIDGHAPGLRDKGLNAYLLGGVKADHEVTTAEEARAKVQAGMYVMIREGSAAHNLAALLQAVDEKNQGRFMYATDDRDPGDLITQGHINWILKEACRLGQDPLDAIRMATLNTANAMGLTNIGAIATGRRADLVVLEDLVDFNPVQVYKDGTLAAKNGKALFEVTEDWECVPQSIKQSVHIKGVRPTDFVLPQADRYRVIELTPGQIVTRQGEAEPDQVNNLPDHNLALLAVVERHHASGRIGLGLLRGLGLNRGAIASSIAHDSHHIIVAGIDPVDIAAAVERISEMQGGLVAVAGGRVIAQMPLPIAGLMSQDPLDSVAAQLNQVERAARDLGVNIKSPYMALSFLALPVIPALKLTDKGLFDAEKFRPVKLKI